MSPALAGRPVRLAVDVLEDRATPATIRWINPAGGAWNDAGNWDLGRTPQPEDDVVIPSLDYRAVIDHASGADVVQSISSSGSYGTLAVTDQSSLRVAGAIDIPTLVACTGGVVMANNTGSLNLYRCERSSRAGRTGFGFDQRPARRGQCGGVVGHAAGCRPSEVRPGPVRVAVPGWCRQGSTADVDRALRGHDVCSTGV
jgi:hypothetical protein